MITNDLMSSIVSLSIFILGVATRRYGLAGLLVMLALLIDICVTHADNPFPYGSVVSIALFVALFICHGAKNQGFYFDFSIQDGIKRMREGGGK